jgi:tRNA A-37 threonylcarbamoyl transferase component Bud32/TolB-like protein
VESGTTLKHYRILSRLGAGGMGVVYRAEDTRLGRTVARKVLPENLADDQHLLRRFEREARAASAINHPGIATLYDFDRDGKTTFLTMEFVEGRTLKEILKEGPLPPERLLDCLAQTAEAMAAAHRKGVVHRDLKPENVMAADSGFYKILDFGLARFQERGAPGGVDPREMETVTRDMTEAGRILGTFAYMSPEQAQGEAVDPRSDIFSFGTLLYELATGEQPFKGKNPISVFHAIVHDEPEPLRALRPGLPPELGQIAARCLAKSPADRYPSAEELSGELRLLRRGSDATGSGFLGTALPRPRPAPRWWRAALGIAAAAAVLTLGLWALRETTGPETAPPTAVTAAAPSPNRILVTFFANRSADPEVDWLTRGLPEMLTTDLARTEGLEVISTQRIYDLLASSGRSEEELDGETAAQLARWAGAGVVVSGAVYRVGETYRIDLQASDTSTGKVLSANRVQGTDLFGMVDRLAADLRAGLQLTAAAQPGIQTVTTASPRAYRLFSQGMDRYEELDFAGAADRFRTALTHDPEFALARLRLGMSRFLAGDDAEGLDWIQRAAEQADRMPERERLLAEGILTSFRRGDAAAGDQALGSLADRFPQDAECRFWRAQAQAMVSDDRLAALQTLRESLSLDPNDPLAVASMVGVLRELNLPREAEAILAEFLQRNPHAPADRMRKLHSPSSRSGG